jgi:hypothetical protein
MNIQELIGILNTHWMNRFENNLGGWHGYGAKSTRNSAREAVDSPVLIFFVSPQVKPSDFKKDLINRIDLLDGQYQIITMLPFRQMHESSLARPSMPLQPGAVVYASADRPCGDGCFGTIGGFLKRTGDKEEDDRWLLSNNHILVRGCQDQTPIRGAGGAPLSHYVESVQLTATGNLVDAAIAKVDWPAEVFAFYDGLTIANPAPEVPAPPSPVQKLGAATGVTNGILEVLQATLFVTDCEGSGGHEFTDQLVISSADDENPFLAHGDSGSLVVSNGRPVGLLFAIGDQVFDIEPSEPKLTAPFGVASPFQSVLDQLPQPHNWTLVLPHDSSSGGQTEPKQS